jgi:hypothetical protein
VRRHRTLRCLSFLAAVTLGAALAPAQLQWEGKDGKTSFRAGLLSQLQAESVDLPGTDENADNIFLRRFRLIGEFKLAEELTVFAETDSPNLGKGAPDGTKDSGDIFLQDVVATWKFAPEFHLDGGLLLNEQSYNHNQSAASLAALDYGPFTFAESTPIGARVGRDEGLRARGYLFDDLLEYRAGIYQGQRGINASNDFRYIGRLMLQLFSAQTSLFYRGTSLGKSQTLAVGASVDKQEDYESYGADLFFEQPFGEGNGVTLQADYVRLDGGSFLPTLTKRDNLLFEASVYLGAPKLQPFVQVAEQDLDAPTGDEHRYTIGLGWFPGGHGNNLKFAYTRIDRGAGSASDQINLQWQVFTF